MITIPPGYEDPRDDLQDDHRLWGRALTLTWYKDHSHVSLWSILHGLRCLGARLEWKDGQAGRYLALVRGEIEPQEWERDRRRWLMPYLEPVKTLLAHMAEEEKIHA